MLTARATHRRDWEAMEAATGMLLFACGCTRPMPIRARSDARASVAAVARTGIAWQLRESCGWPPSPACVRCAGCHTGTVPPPRCEPLDC